MAAPKGNDFWRLRTTTGRKGIYQSPDELWDEACEYFDSVLDNPIITMQNLGTKNVNEVELIRPFTKDGLCIFLDIDDSTFNRYRDEVQGFSEVTRKIERIIRNQKFEGATVGIFNHNIIARDLGLKDVTQQELSITPISKIEIIHTDAGKQGT